MVKHHASINKVFVDLIGIYGTKKLNTEIEKQRKKMAS